MKETNPENDCLAVGAVENYKVEKERACQVIPQTIGQSIDCRLKHHRAEIHRLETLKNRLNGSTNVLDMSVDEIVKLAMY